jgi:hypothetical protein
MQMLFEDDIRICPKLARKLGATKAELVTELKTCAKVFLDHCDDLVILRRVYRLLWDGLTNEKREIIKQQIM